MRVMITDHAWRRWQERAGPVDRKAVKKFVRTRLKAQLRLGLEANKHGKYLLEMYHGLTAILGIDSAGYWVVLTFYWRRTDGKAGGNG